LLVTLPPSGASGAQLETILMTMFLPSIAVA
jgi:hypothetical protein